MARIRTTKPEFWADEKLGPRSPLTRLVYMGLWTMADDAGRIVDSVKQIDAFLFAHTEDTCRTALDELAALERIKRGKNESGQQVIQIVRWHHQKIDKPNTRAMLKPIVEAPPKRSRKSRESAANVAGESAAAVGDGSVPVPTTNDRGPVSGPPSGTGTDTGEQDQLPTRRSSPSPRPVGTAPRAKGDGNCTTCQGRRGIHAPGCPLEKAEPAA